MPRGGLMRAAATASMISSARTNRAVRKGIENNKTIMFKINLVLNQQQHKMI